MGSVIRGLICLSALFAATTPLRALAISLPPGASDMVEITNDLGTPVTDSDGNPAVAMLLESDEASASASATLTVGFQLSPATT